MVGCGLWFRSAFRVAPGHQVIALGANPFHGLADFAAVVRVERALADGAEIGFFHFVTSCLKVAMQ